MSNELTRFASGEVKGYNLNKKNKGGKYGFAFEGFFEDTKDKLEGYFASNFPIKIFEGNSNDSIDPSEAQDLKFKGRVMFTQKDYNDKQYLFPQALSIEKRMEIMERTEPEELKDNPFLDNPIR